MLRHLMEYTWGSMYTRVCSRGSSGVKTCSKAPAPTRGIPRGRSLRALAPPCSTPSLVARHRPSAALQRVPCCHLGFQSAGHRHLRNALARPFRQHLRSPGRWALGGGFHQPLPAASRYPPLPRLGPQGYPLLSSLSPSPQLPVPADRPTHRFWPSLHLPLSYHIPCPAQNDALFHTNVLHTLPPHPHRLLPRGLLRSPPCKFSKSSRRPSTWFLLDSPPSTWGQCSRDPHTPLSLSKSFCRQKRPHPGTPLPLNCTPAPLAPRRVTYGLLVSRGF